MDQAAAEPTRAVDPAKERMQKDAEKCIANAMNWLVFLGSWFTISLKIVTTFIMMFVEISVHAYHGLCLVYTFPKTRPFVSQAFSELVAHLTGKAKIDMRKAYHGRDDIDDQHLTLETLEQEPKLTDVGIETRASLVSLVDADEMLTVDWVLKRFGYRHKKQPTEPNSDSLDDDCEIIDEQPPATAVGSEAMLDVSDSTQQLSAVDRNTEVPSSSLMTLSYAHISPNSDEVQQVQQGAQSDILSTSTYRSETAVSEIDKLIQDDMDLITFDDEDIGTQV